MSLVEFDDQFLMWTPSPGECLRNACSDEVLELPSLALPVERAGSDGSPPDYELLGASLASFLRRYPDAPHASVYAGLLRDGYVYYLADMAAQVMMIGHKEVDPAYRRRKINYLKILSHLEPENSRILLQMGVGCLELASTLSEAPRSRDYLLEALRHLDAALKINESLAQAWSYQALINSYLGDYPAAVRGYRRLSGLVPDAPTRSAVEARILELEAAEFPENPLALQMEEVGAVLELYRTSAFAEALMRLEILEEQGTIFSELPSADLYSLLGLLREKNGDFPGAMQAYLTALELEPEHHPSREGCRRIQEEGR